MFDVIYRFDPDYREEPHGPPTPAAARERLIAGNREFAAFGTPKDSGQPHVVPFDLRDIGVADQPGQAPRQQPFAVVLGCSDARVPTEMIFNQGCNDLFVVRAAGNILDLGGLGSIDYATTQMREAVKLVVVLGHSQCGAVSAAVDAFLDPKKYLSLALSHALRSIVDRLFIAVQASAKALESAYGDGIWYEAGLRPALIEAAVVMNAALAAYTLQKELSDRRPEECQVVYGVYDLATRQVGVPLAAAPQIDLCTPPAGEQEFSQFAAKLAQAPLIRLLLQAKS
ncbi:MAG: carbonic anhydrase [Pirellulales bacterium]